MGKAAGAEQASVLQLCSHGCSPSPVPGVLAEITGLSSDDVTWMLALCGVSVVVENFLGGRVSDKAVVPRWR